MAIKLVIQRILRSIAKGMEGLADSFDGVTGEVTVSLDTEVGQLKPVARTTIPARTKPINLAEFYQDGPDLAVDDVLTDRLRESARQVVNSAPERSYVAVPLKEINRSPEIMEEYPQPSTLEDLAALIVAQLGGQSGFLLNNGASNLALVENDSVVTIVDITRIGCDSLWWVCDIDSGDLDDDLFAADSQVLLVCSQAS